LYVCGDAGGFPIEPVNGNPVSQLGVNLPEIAERIKAAFLPEKIVGPGYFRLNAALKSDHSSAFGLLFFLVQIVRQEFGKPAEEELELKAYRVTRDGEPIELSPRECATFVRAIAEAIRVREPDKIGLESAMKDTEANIVLKLRRPTDEDIRNQVRRVIWPIGAVILIQ